MLKIIMWCIFGTYVICAGFYYLGVSDNTNDFIFTHPNPYKRVLLCIFCGPLAWLVGILVCINWFFLCLIDIPIKWFQKK